MPADREEDLVLLDALLADVVELREYERVAFDDMRDKLGKYQRELTRDQRRWLVGVAERLDVTTQSPAERNANVPRGREVAAPAVLSQESLRKALDRRRSR